MVAIAGGAALGSLLKLLGISTAVGVGGSALSGAGGTLGSTTVGLGAAGPIGFAGGAGYGLGIRTGFEQIYEQVKKGQLTISQALELINQTAGGQGASDIGADFASGLGTNQPTTIAELLAEGDALPTVDPTPTVDDRPVPPPPPLHPTVTAFQEKAALGKIVIPEPEVHIWQIKLGLTKGLNFAKKDAIQRFYKKRPARKYNIIKVEHVIFNAGLSNEFVRFTIHYKKR